MDPNVIAAMARWPDVPNAYGWLSLTESGLWRLHPRGDAWQPESSAAAPGTNHHDTAADTPGTSITSPQILQFINRNYNCDQHGQWFFQNGPQKVYVRLDGAPYILQTVGDSAAGTIALRTHNGLDVKTITAWLLDESGKLYAQTEYGPGLIAGRDLATVLDCIHTPQGLGILDALNEAGIELPVAVLTFSGDARASVAAAGSATEAVASDYAPLALIRPTNPSQPTVLFKTCATQAIEQELGFVRYPRPATS